MSDVIDRQAAIDAMMPIYKSASLRNRNVFSTARKCMSAIEELPSAQPEIIRCEECKYNSNTCGNYVNCDIIPQMFGRMVDNFCSMAERRTDDC